MLKKFSSVPKFQRKSIARELEEGMAEHNQKVLKQQKNKRVLKFNQRYI